MRSPNGRTPIVYYCANCDENQTCKGVCFFEFAGSDIIAARGATSTTSLVPADQALAQHSPSISSSSHQSRSSTPPTELSSTLSSPTFALPAETPESLWRRQQSDTASSEIAKRLLKGWAMLGEECPNVRCFGVPLVRPPKAGGKDPRMART
jgi:hypothetical protein